MTNKVFTTAIPPKKVLASGIIGKSISKASESSKNAELSDRTLFKLNNTHSPYNSGTDLIEVKLLLKESNRKGVRGKTTTDFIGYAILISNSENQVPIEKM